MKTDLKPCPLCKGKTIFVEDKWGIKIRCPSCGLELYRYKSKPMKRDGDYSELKEEMAAKWNRRAGL